MKKQIKRTISVLLSIIIVASLFAIVPIEAGAAGNSFSGATQYYTGNQVSGSITTSNQADYYRVAISNSGSVSLSVTAYIDKIFMHIYDSSYNLVWETTSSWNSTTKTLIFNDNICLTSGTYYFIIEGYNFWSGSEAYGNYNFKINYTSANESFKEYQGGSNNTYNVANSINLNTDYKGQIAYNDKCDFYKFNMSSSGKIKLNVTAYIDKIFIHIYDSSYNLVWETTKSWNSTTKTLTFGDSICLTSGTYYFMIEGYNFWSGSNAYGNYNFNTNFSSANESFKENQGGSNNTYNVANSINLNTNYKGQIAYNDKCDFFKFNMSSSGKINLSVTAYIDKIYMHIYNSSYNQVWETTKSWNSTTKTLTFNDSISLTYGTYYFMIEGYNFWSGSESFGNYNFTLSKSSSPVTPSVQPVKPAAPTVSVANGINGLDVAWGNVANAKSYVVYYKTASSNWSSFSTTSTKATIANISSGKLYYVQVQSIGANGVKGNYSKVKSMTYLARTNITSLTYNGNNNLKYNSVSGANKYQIARLKSGDKSYTYFYSTTPTFTEKNAVGGVAYTYQVRAMYQTANNGTAYGAWSASKSVPTLVAPTVTLANKSNGIRVTWNSIRGAIRYIVYFKKSTDKNWSSAVTTNLYYPILNTTRGATYYVQVRPVGSTVSTPYSNVKSIVFK